MKKTIIAAIVGGIIIFTWQFLSNAALNFHEDEQKYTANQDAILKVLDENLPEEGQYFLPNLPPGYTAEEYEAHAKEVEGKPWAQVFYHKANDMSMPINMARGLIANILVAFLLAWLLMKMNAPSMSTMVMSSLAIGLMAYLTETYPIAIWYKHETLMTLIDAIVIWGLLGLWMGWYLRR